MPLNLDFFGPQSVVWASDYPHRDARFPGVAREMLERDDLTDEQKRAVLGENAIRFYGLQSVTAA